MSEHHAVLLVNKDLENVDLPKKYQVNSTDVNHLYFEKLTLNEVKQLIAKLNIRPYSKEEQVFVVSLREITTEAQNALLKILEDPPADVKIYFIVPYEEILLKTVRSRMQILNKASVKDTPSNNNYKDFKKLNYGHRLETISMKVKDKEWVNSMINGMESEAYLTKNRSLMREVLFARKFLHLSGSSPKMLIEHCTLITPLEN